MVIGGVPAEARVGPVTRQAWENVKPHFWWLLLFAFISWLPSSVSSDASAEFGTGALLINLTGGVLAIFVGIPLGVGITKAHLAVSRGQKPTWGDLFYAFGPRYGQSVLVGVLSALIVIGGLLLFIVPGIMWAVKLAFAQVRFIEDDLRAVDAIKASFRDVEGHWWDVGGLIVAMIGIILLGLLALLVGVVFSIVLVSQMGVVYWRALRGEGRAPSGVPPPTEW